MREIIIEQMKKDNIDISGKKPEDLEDYIMFKAKKKLDGKAGAIKDEVVFGWALHFYHEPENVIDKEMGISKKSKEEKVEEEKSKKESINPLVNKSEKKQAQQEEKVEEEKDNQIRFEL